MKIFNKNYNREYQEIERYEAGISLTGAEVKSMRAGHVRLEDSFVKLVGNEVHLINANVPIYSFARPQGYDSRRTRRLLLHKKEIIRLKTKLLGSSKLTIVPVSCYNKGNLIKLEIALARGRREIEKKKLEKKRDIVIQEKREMKEYIKS